MNARQFLAGLYVGASLLGGGLILFTANGLLRFLEQRGAGEIGVSLFLALFVLAILLPISAFYIVAKAQREEST